MENLMTHQDEYPIVWYNPNTDSKEDDDLIEENKSVSSFVKFEEMVEFCVSLNTSFMAIVQSDFQSEDELLKEVKNHKDVYKRRLADFEEESVITGVFKKVPVGQSSKVYVFYTRKDFEAEILIKEVVEEAMGLSKAKIPKAAQDFVEEFIFWEMNKTAQKKQANQSEEDFEEKDHLECKEWCVGGLKELVLKRNKEKIKTIYYMILAEIQTNLDEDQQALEGYQKVLAVFQDIYEEIHPTSATLYNTLGMEYKKRKQYKKSHECFIRACELRKLLFPENDPRIADSYENLGLSSDSLGNPQKALEYFLKAAEIKKSIYGEIHPGTCKTYGNIGGAYNHLGENEKALEYHLKVHEYIKSAYQENDPNMARSYENLGTFIII